MTKEELEKATGQELIDERNYCGVDGYYGDYLDNVNAEMLKRFNRLAELEKENAELKDKLKNLENVAEVRLANWQKYEKAYNEAEELLDKQIEATYNVVEENKEAKEIIKELLFTSNELDENTRSKAEQFLNSEVEK